MAESLTTLATPLDIEITDQQLAGLFGDATVLTRLLVVRDIQEDDNGALLRFQEGAEGRLDQDDANYATYLRLVRRSQERQHPLGVGFGNGQAITELMRADNDVPSKVWQDGPGPTRLLFEGHDGVYLLRHDHPESSRIRGLLEQATRQRARIWYVARKSDLALLDVQPAGWAVGRFRISFVVAPDHLLRTADEILRSNIRCTKALRNDIRVVAKAYIDEADELNRAVRDVQMQAARVQIETHSPEEVLEKAKGLETVQLANKGMQEKVRAVANSYLLIAKENQRLYEEFKEKYRDLLPPTK